MSNIAISIQNFNIHSIVHVELETTKYYQLNIESPIIVLLLECIKQLNIQNDKNYDIILNFCYNINHIPKVYINKLELQCDDFTQEMKNIIDEELEGQHISKNYLYNFGSIIESLEYEDEISREQYYNSENRMNIVEIQC